MLRRSMLRLIALPLLAQRPLWAQANSAAAANVYRIATLLENDPATVIASRILEIAYKRLNLQIKVEQLPGERALRSANNGEMDGELYRRAGIEKDYPNLLQVAVPLMNYEIVVFCRDPSIVVPNWDALRSFAIGFVKGVKIIEANTQGMRADPTPTLRQAFMKLMLGRSDLVVANRLSGLAALRELNLDEMRILNPPLAKFPVFHYLHNKHASIVPQLFKVLSQMQDEKLITEIQHAVSHELSQLPKGQPGKEF